MAISVADLVQAAPAIPAAAAKGAAVGASAAEQATGGPKRYFQPTAEDLNAPPTPGALQEPLSPKDDSAAQIPDEVLQIPAFRALLEGSPPAVAVTKPELEASPELQTIQKNVEPLLYSGFGVYQAKDGQTAVFYNSQFIDGKALQIADEKGKLTAVAAPFADLKSHFDQGLAGEGSAPAPAAAPAPTAAPPQVTAPPPAPAAQSKLSTARLMSAAPGAPTSGPVPGQGRVMSQILKPAV